MLRFVNNVWHVRDLGSTNGTTVNGTQIASETTLMPDDEPGIAGRLFTIDYEPAGPESVIRKHEVIEEDLMDSRKKTSLMELAGLDTEAITALIRDRMEESFLEASRALTSDMTY